MPYSWKLSTTISNNEASENYKEVNDPAVMVSKLAGLIHKWRSQEATDKALFRMSAPESGIAASQF